ncbi:S1 RNA-binding domain-containing protein [Candidatus Woesearchaeota archaeon]|nr:S1 RNA-binding domain-containing protein [Candidatus Woesearchaeota archaeon]
MFYKKTGLPAEGELVLCTVAEVHFNSVFVMLDEYDLKAFLHISEVSPGRIRNIRDFVKEGKVIVCVVLNVVPDRKLIDVSLRRVNDGQKRAKLNEVKLEQKAEKIIEFAAKELKTDVKKLYDELKAKIFSQYPNMYSCFEDVSLNDISLSHLGIRPDVEKILIELVKQRIKPPKVTISGKITLSTYESNGVEVVKEILQKGLSIGGSNTTIRYLGAGIYKLDIVAEDYKSAEKILSNTTSIIEKETKKHNGTYGFERVESS